MRNLRLRATAVAAWTILVPLAGLSAQYDIGKRYDVAQLREDFRVLRSALEEGHSGLYRYSPKHAIDRLFDDVSSRIRMPLTELEFMRLISPVVGGVNDGHTRLIASTGLAGHLERQPYHFPFKLAFVEGRAYFHHDYTPDRVLTMGAELTHVNGVSLAEVTGRLFPSLQSDGRVETSKWRRLESATNFANAYAVEFGVSTVFELRYRATNGRVEERTVQGVTRSQLLAQLRERYPEAAATRPPIEVTYRGDIPILTVRTFGSHGYRNAGIAFPQFLRDAFQEFADRRAEHVIIDVRDNGGGSDEFGRLLVAHLLDREFLYYESLVVNRNQFDFLRYASQSNDDIPRERLRERADGAFDLLGHSNLGLQQPESPVFGGEVYVLTNGRSFSATGEFTSILHQHRPATFIGEEGGAGYYGNTSGMGATVTLPNTKLRVSVPLVRYTMAVSGYEPTDRGLIPEHQVSPTIEDLLAGRDAVLEYALQLIEARTP